MSVNKRVADEMGRCIHMCGIRGHDSACVAGVNYRQLVGGKSFGWLLRTPCLADHETSVVCDQRQFPSKEEAKASVARSDAAVAEHIRLLNAKVCPSCHKNYEGKQVLRCVYCEHCNTRLYQGDLTP